MTTQETIYIISGEGTQGTRELYTGKLSQRAMRARLTREQCGGDRWARYEDASGRTVYPEQYPDLTTAQHLRAMVRDLTHTRDELCAATGITRRALDTYMLPDGSSGHRTPPPLALRAVEALWREHQANKGK